MRYSRLRASALAIVAASAVAALLAGAGGATIASAPTNSVAPAATSSNLVQGTAASTNSGSWNGSNITFTYKWETCTDNNDATETTNCSDISGATGRTYQFQATDVGDYVRSLVRATNSDGFNDAYSNALGPITAATAPVGVAPTISGTAKVGQTLTANDNTGSWTGTTPITYTHQWQRCDSSGNSCSDIGSQTSSTYVVTSSDLGDTLREETTGTNVAGSDQEESNATAVVAAGQPVNTALPVVSGIDTTGSRLTTTNGTWLGSTPITYAYVWKRCDTNGNNCNIISGATASNYTLTSSDAAHDIRSAVTATNSAGSTTATSAATASVASGAPVNTVAPAITGTTVVGQQLSANNGTWTGITPITYTYAWQRCDANGNNCASISGATRNNYTLVTADLNAKIAAQVTATNAAGTKAVTSNFVGPVTSNAPVNTVAPVLSGTLTSGQTMSVTTGTWTGQSPITYVYAWQRCTATASVCTAITGATRATYQLQGTDVLAYIRVTVTAANRGGSTTANSNLVGPVQAAPPRGAVKLANGQTSVSIDNLPPTDVLRITSLKLKPAVIKHRHAIKITLRVIDKSAYVVSGVKLSVTSTKPTWIKRVVTASTTINGLVTVLIRPTTKAPLKGILILRLKALPRHGATPASAIKTVKITMRA